MTGTLKSNLSLLLDYPTLQVTTNFLTIKDYITQADDHLVFNLNKIELPYYNA